MRFSLDGKDYRIGFHHDPPVPPRGWDEHTRHEVFLREIGNRVELHCATCDIDLTPMSPHVTNSFRASAVYPRDFLRRARPPARDVDCVIYEPAPGTETGARRWVPIYQGRSRLNVDAGDVYTRETGRLAALRNAIRDAPAPIKAAAMHAYLTRPRGETKKRGA